MAAETLSPEELRSKYPHARAKDALAAGEIFYFTGRPCKHGHIARRYTVSESCYVCKSAYVYHPPTEARRAKRRAKYKENPKKYLTQNRERTIRRRINRPWVPAISQARARAKKKKLAFNLTWEWGKSVWTGFCAITSIKFDLAAVKNSPYSPSIDRIDNSLGYTKNNCRFILYGINVFKWTSTDFDILYLSTAVVNSAWALQLRQQQVNDPARSRRAPA